MNVLGIEVSILYRDRQLFNFEQRANRLWRPSNFLSHRFRRLPPRRWIGRGVKLNIHLHIVMLPHTSSPFIKHSMTAAKWPPSCVPSPRQAGTIVVYETPMLRVFSPTFPTSGVGCLKFFSPILRLHPPSELCRPLSINNSDYLIDTCGPTCCVLVFLFYLINVNNNNSMNSKMKISVMGF